MVLQLSIILIMVAKLSYMVMAGPQARVSDPKVNHGEPILSDDPLSNIKVGKSLFMDGDIPGPALSPGDFNHGKEMLHPSPDANSLDPIEFAHAFQGDIILRNKQELFDFTTAKDAQLARNAIIDKTQTWPNAVIPYVISSSYNTQERAIIATAMGHYHRATCIRFTPRRTEGDYIHILKGDGCSSSVGRMGSAQAVSLGEGCLYMGIVLHELMHAAGFWHEQSREDRDGYITIVWSNIQIGMAYNFHKYSWKTIDALGAKYDIESIMHYGPSAFAKNRNRPTIIARSPGKDMGQRRGFSKIDIQKLNTLYKCSGTGSIVSTLAPITTPSPDRCEDSSVSCPTWKGYGECVSNSEWMHLNCMKSCSQCNKACKDHNSYCDFWLNEGECTQNPEYMKLFCKKSCGLCHAASDLTTKCEDKNKYCSHWAKDGQCRANTDYMLLYCKKSCGQC